MPAERTYDALPSVEATVTLGQSRSEEASWKLLASRTVTRVRAGMIGAYEDSLGPLSQHSVKPYRITGVAVDSNETPVEGAEVLLLRGDFRAGHVVQRTTSGADGGYLFYVDDPGDQYVVLAFKAAAEEIRGATTRTLTGVAV